MSESKGVSQLFMTLILIVVALALTPIIADGAYHASHYAGIVGTTAATLLDLVPLFWVISVLGMGVAAIYFYFK